MANWKEEWKPVVGAPKYEVSNKGRVYSKHSFKQLSPVSTGAGVSVNIAGLGVVRLEKLVATAFLPELEPDQMVHINHKDGNPRNNLYTNLEWLSADAYAELKRERKAKAKAARKPKVDTKTRWQILAYRIDGASMEEISEVFGISTSYASRVCRAGLEKHKAKTLDGKRVVKYWYAGETPPDNWADGSVPIRVRVQVAD